MASVGCDRFSWSITSYYGVFRPQSQPRKAEGKLAASSLFESQCVFILTRQSEGSKTHIQQASDASTSCGSRCSGLKGFTNHILYGVHKVPTEYILSESQLTHETNILSALPCQLNPNIRTRLSPTIAQPTHQEGFPPRLQRLHQPFGALPYLNIAERSLSAIRTTP